MGSRGPTVTSLRLGVLDQSPIPSGSTATDALANTIDLARQCEALGYDRFWVAEHHNSAGLAGAAPEILIGAVAAATETIRVGSGGIMLSHYSPYKVAEWFKILGSLHPGRIDLGLGRAPGSDPITMYALAQANELRPVDHYPSTVRELLGFLHDDLPEDSPFRGKVRSVPSAAPDAVPPVWLLSSSPGSASFAAHFGLPLSYAHFFGAGDGPSIVRGYRDAFQPDAAGSTPRVNIAAGVICAETDDEARLAASSVAAWRARGLSGPIPTPEEAQRIGADPLHVQPGRPEMIVGTPDRVRADLEALAASYETDEVLVVSITWDHKTRVRSYELIAEVFEMSPPARPPRLASSQTG